MNNETFEIVAKTLYGLEDVLAQELQDLGATDIEVGRRMVSFKGDQELLYKANFYSRTALRILKPIYHFKANDADIVYQEAKKVEWEKYLAIDKTFAIDSVIYSEDFNHSKFVAYRTKDAIVDYFSEKFGKRPSVRINNPDLYINIHISHDDCTLSIDSSGESLHKRGYRVKDGDAPLSEVLAAGMILLTGWHGESNFVDPMCGSGTLLIEAALIARNIAPGVFRKEFAFQKWIDYDEELFDKIYNDDSMERKFEFKCYGSDISPVAIDNATENVRSAGMAAYVDLKVLPFQQMTEAPQPGILVTNPPYGERIRPNDLMSLYSMIGERLKHVFMGYEAWIISYHEECFDKIGLRPKEKIKLMNGSLECEYHCYEMFEGKNEDYKAALYAQRNRYDEQDSDSDSDTDDEQPRRKPNFKSDKMDTPERRFAASHADDGKAPADDSDENSTDSTDSTDSENITEEDDFDKFASSRESVRPKGERRMRFHDDDKSFGKKRFTDRKKDFGDRRSFDDHKSFDSHSDDDMRVDDADDFDNSSYTERRSSYGDRRDSGERKSYGDRRPTGGYGERRSYGDRKDFGDRKSYGDRKDFGERKSYGDRKDFGDKKDFGERKSYGDRKPTGGYGERKDFGDRKSFGERKSYGDRKDFGDRKGFGERKDFGDRKFGDNKFGDRKFGDNKFGDRKFGDKKFGDRKFGDNKKFGDRKFGERKGFGDRKPDYNKPYKSRDWKDKRDRNDSED